MTTDTSVTPATQTILRPGWRVVRFDAMAENVNDRVDDPAEAGVEYYVGLEHLDPESLKVRRWGKPTDVEATKLRFKPGDIIFGRRRAYQRKLAVAEFEGICSAHAMVLRAREKVVLPEFLPFFMQSDIFFERAMSISVGSLSPTINWKTLAVQEFALPPRDEQRRIAEILWAADEAVERLYECLTAQNILKQALLVDNFSTRTTTASQISLGEIGKWFSGGTPSRANATFWKGDLPWASPKDMKTDTLVVTDELVSSEGANAGSRIVPQGTIFIVVRGMILAHTFPVAIAGRSMAFNQDMKALVVSPKFMSKYVFYWFQYKSKDILQLVSDSSHGTKRLPTDELFRMKMPAISSEAQNKVVNILVQCDEAISRFKLQILHLSEVKRTLLRQLLQPRLEE